MKQKGFHISCFTVDRILHIIIINEANDACSTSNIDFSNVNAELNGSPLNVLILSSHISYVIRQVATGLVNGWYSNSS